MAARTIAVAGFAPALATLPDGGKATASPLACREGNSLKAFSSKNFDVEFQWAYIKFANRFRLGEHMIDTERCAMPSSPEMIAPRIIATAEIMRLAPNIGKDTEEVLADMYSAKQLKGTASDELISIDTMVRISIAQGAQINQLLRQSETNRSLEVGFAYGFSTVWILDGLRSRRNSHHIAIDPFELTLWSGVGLHQANRLSVAPSFEWISEYSIHALSKLIKSEEKFDFIFIDGNHHFDGALVDFFLSDQLVSPGGLVAFDDMWMPSVRTVISFILSNRQYKIIPQPVPNMVVLKKIADDNRDWLHFEKFRIHKEGDDYSEPNVWF